MGSESTEKQSADLNELVPLFMGATPERRTAAMVALKGDPKGDTVNRPGSLRLFKMGEAAKVTGLSRTTVWRMVREGRVKAVETRCGRLRIPEGELMGLVAT